MLKTHDEERRVLPLELALNPYLGLPFNNTVMLDARCSVCAGTGMVYSEEWRAWNEQHDASAPKRANFAEYDEWDACMREWERNHPMPDGNEEVHCGECDGAGAIPTAAGSVILALVDRYRR
jgi:hypothetical protein